MLIKSIPFEYKMDSTEDRVFEGYASVFGNKDLHGEVVDKGAFKKTISERLDKGLIKVLWQHKDPIGMPIEMHEDRTGLYVKARISETALGNDALTLMRDGVVDHMSIGFMPVKTKIEQIDKEDVLHHTEVKLYEFSPVTFPANELAAISSVKEMEILDAFAKRMDEFERNLRSWRGVDISVSKDECDCGECLNCNRLAVDSDEVTENATNYFGEMEVDSGSEEREIKASPAATNLPIASRTHSWDGDAARTRMRSAAGGGQNIDDMDWTEYGRGFMFHDSSNPKEIGSYKLPFADIIDGTLTAIPRGIFAIAAIMRGGRGGVDGVSDGDRSTIESKINGYYAKMRRAFNDPNLRSPWEKIEMDETEIKQEIRQGLENLQLVTNGIIDSKAIDDAISAAVNALFGIAEPPTVEEVQSPSTNEDTLIAEEPLTENDDPVFQSLLKEMLEFGAELNKRTEKTGE